MTVELTYLAYAIALFFVVVFLQAGAGIRNRSSSASLLRALPDRSPASYANGTSRSPAGFQSS